MFSMAWDTAQTIRDDGSAMRVVGEESIHHNSVNLGKFWAIVSNCT
jgi:hypothetical protein